MASSKKKSPASSPVVDVEVAGATPATPPQTTLERANGLRKKIEKITATVTKQVKDRTELMDQLKSIQDMCKHSWGLPQATADRSRVKVRCETCGYEQLVRRDSIKVTGL